MAKRLGEILPTVMQKIKWTIRTISNGQMILI